MYVRSRWAFLFEGTRDTAFRGRGVDLVIADPFAIRFAHPFAEVAAVKRLDASRHAI